MPNLSAHRLITWIAPLLLLLAIIVGSVAVAWHHFEEQLVANTGHSLAMAADSLASSLDRFLIERVGDLDLLSRSPTLRTTEHDTVTAQLLALQRAYHPLYQWVGVTDLRGQVVAATDPATVGADWSRRPCVVEVRKTGRLYVRSAEPSPEAGHKQVVSFNAPLFDAKGALVGVLTAHVLVSALRDVFDGTLRGFEAMRNPAGPIEWQFVTPEGTLVLDSSLGEEGRTSLPAADLPSLTLSASGQRGYVEETHQRRRRPTITGYAQAQGGGKFPALRWTVLVRMDRDAILAPLRRQLAQAAAAGTALGLPLFGLLLWTSVQLHRAHREMETQVQAKTLGLRQANEQLAKEIQIREQTEEALRESDRTYRELMESSQQLSHLGSFERDLTANRSHWSDELFRIYGFEPQSFEPTRERFLAAQHPEDLPALLEKLQDVERSSTDDPLWIEHRILRPNGEVRWLISACAVRTDAHGTPQRLVGTSLDITDRKRAEEQLHLKQIEQQALLDLIPAMVWYKDRRNHIIRSNRAAAASIGKIPAEVEGRSVYDLYPGEAEQYYRDDMEVIASGRPKLGIIEPLETAPGGKRWIRTDKVPYRDGQGRIVGVLVFAQDITDHRNAETAVRDSQRRLQSILDSMFAFVGCYTPDGVLIEANRAPLAAANLRREDVLGKPFWDTYWWNYSAASQEKIRETLRRAAQGEPVRDDFVVRVAEDRFITIDATFGPLHDETGRIVQLIGSGVDITERKQAETKILQQARLLDLIFAHSLDCIVLLDREYNFIRVSESYATACRKHVSEFPGRNHFDLYPSPLKDEFDEAIRRRTVYSTTSHPFTFPDHPEWGATYWDLGMVPIRNAHDEIELLLFTLKDVTDRERAEEGRRRSERRLRALLEDRERLSRDLHDNIIQTLYALGIRLEENLELIADNPEAARRSLRSVVADLNHVMDEVRRYIGKGVPTVMNQQDFFAELEDLAWNSRGGTFAGFSLDVDPDALGHVGPDACRHLALIAREAVSNCRRHAQASSGRILLRQQDHWLRLSIEDDGVGFLPEKPSADGMGLKNMADRARQLGGRLRILSAPGQGTRIIVEVPRENATVTAFRDTDPPPAGGRS